MVVTVPETAQGGCLVRASSCLGFLHYQTLITVLTVNTIPVHTGVLGACAFLTPFSPQHDFLCYGSPLAFYKAFSRPPSL